MNTRPNVNGTDGDARFDGALRQHNATAVDRVSPRVRAQLAQRRNAALRGERVAPAHGMRYAAAGLPHIRTNAEAPASLLEQIAQPDAQGLKLLRDAAETMRLSARGYHRVLRVARTLADLDGTDKIGRLHLAEALSYRVLAEDARRAA